MDSKITHLLGFQPFVASGFEPDEAEKQAIIKNLPLKRVTEGGSIISKTPARERDLERDKVGYWQKNFFLLPLPENLLHPFTLQFFALNLLLFLLLLLSLLLLLYLYPFALNLLLLPLLLLLLFLLFLLFLPLTLSTAFTVLEPM